MPTATDLDRVTPHHPVILWRVDLHLAVANSSGLKKAGIDHATPDPDQGRIDRDQKGQPSGILRERAIQMVKAHLPRPALSALTQTMRSGMAALHARGITGVHDIRLMGGNEGPLSMQAWQQLDANGELALRCWVGLPGERIDQAIGLGLKSGWGSDRLRIGHLKYFSDGSMGARTAWLQKPYNDAASGMPLTSMQEIGQAVQRADQAGLAVMVHAIGDRASHELVSIFENLRRAQNRPTDKPGARLRIPHRIEHLQMIQPHDLKRLATLGVVASVQPHHLALDMEMIEHSLGQRGQHCYVFNHMLNAGIPLIFGSDYPVCDYNPLAGIHSAVTRQNTMGLPADGWYPDQCLTVDEAVRAYTITPAQVSGAGHTLGTLSVNKRADLIVLDRNIYAIPAADILDTKIDMTLFDGQIVYRRPS
jgi:predicted amidohydrolase YtcJ